MILSLLRQVLYQYLLPLYKIIQVESSHHILYSVFAESVPVLVQGLERSHVAQIYDVPL